MSQLKRVLRIGQRQPLFSRACHQKVNVAEAKQQELHEQLLSNLESFEPPSITKEEHKEEIMSFIQQQQTNIPTDKIEMYAINFINNVAKYGTYYALSAPFAAQCNMVKWFIDKYVDFDALPAALCSQDALRYSQPNSIAAEAYLRFVPLGVNMKYYGNHSFITIEKILGGCYPILPNQNEEKQGKKLLLLDLDSSLIDSPAERPYLPEFLEFVSSRFEIAIHSAGCDMHDLIDKWNREYCDGHIMYYLCKSDKYLLPFSMNRSHFLHLDDTMNDQFRWVHIQPFVRRNLEDEELKNVMEYLSLYAEFDGDDRAFLESHPSEEYLCSYSCDNCRNFFHQLGGGFRGHSDENYCKTSV